MKVLNIQPSQNIYQTKHLAFRGGVDTCENDNFQKGHKVSDIKITVPKSIFDVFKSQETKEKEANQVAIITKSAEKIDKYLTEQGFTPCKDYVLSEKLIDPLGLKKIGGRYIYKLGIIGISPKITDNEEEYSFLLLHEQGHYLHHQKLKQLGMNFKAVPLEDNEKKVIFDNYKRLFASQNVENIDDVINNTYLENSLEFVGYYFTFKHRGVKFDEAVDKIYEKYYGP